MIEFIGKILQRFTQGKSEAYVAFAFLQMIGIFVLAFYRPDTNWIGVAAALAAINGPFFAGAAWVAQSNRKFSNGGSAPVTG